MAETRNNQSFDGFPNTLPASDGMPLEKLAGYFATQGPLPTELAAPLFDWPDEGIAVFAGDAPEPGILAANCLPVYGRGAGGTPVVPTGRLFVRGEPGSSLADRREALEAAGFVIDQILSYAPHAGWLRAASGRAEDAFHGWERLRLLPELVHIEPQWLQPRQLRDD